MLIALLFATLYAAPQQPSVDVPYKGLNYSMLSHNGVTIMVAPLHRTILDYSTVQVWISNGSKQPVKISPQFFEVRENGASTAAVSDDEAVKVIPERASAKDIQALVDVYESVILGFDNEQSHTYMQERQAQRQQQRGRGGRGRAAGSGSVDPSADPSGKYHTISIVSAIILPAKTLAPGESIDGTAFFRLKPKNAHISDVVAHLAGADYDFPQSASTEEHVH